MVNNVMVRRRQMLDCVPPPILPYEYQQVEYIEATGTQYLATRAFEAVTKVECDAEFTVAQNGDQMIFGAYQANASWYAEYYGGRNWYCGISQVRYSSVGNCGMPYYNEVIGVRFQFILSDASLRVITASSDVSVAPNATTSNPTYPIYIFARNNNNNPQYINKGLKIYSFKMFDGNNLVQELIPCYRKSDGVIGMYDTVSRTFFTNSGTGTFLKGADV